MRAAVVVLLLSCACPAPVPLEPISVKLALAAGDPSCDDDELIESIDSVRIFANAVSTPCISISAVDTVAELETGLREQGIALPPIEETAGTLTVLGYDSEGCDAADEDMCGQAPFTLPDDDTITVPLFCEDEVPSSAVADCLATAP